MSYTTTSHMRRSLNLLKSLLFEDSGKNRESENLTRICKKLGIWGRSNEEIKQRAIDMTNPPRIVVAPPIIENLQEDIDEDIEEPLFTEEKKIKIKIVSKNIDNVPLELVEKKKKKKRKSKEKIRGQSKTSKDAQLSLPSNGLDDVVEEEKDENFYYIKNHKFYKEEVDKQIGLFNDMAKNYYELDDRATHLFNSLRKTTDEEEKSFILENYNDYEKSARKMLENILIAFPY